MNINSQTNKNLNYKQMSDSSYKIYGRVRNIYKKKLEMWSNNYLVETSLDTGVFTKDCYDHFIATYKIDTKRFTVISFGRYLKQILKQKNLIFKHEKAHVAEKNDTGTNHTTRNKYFGLALKNIPQINEIKNKNSFNEQNENLLNNEIIYDKIKTWVLENIIIDKKFNNKIRTKVILNHYLKSHNLPETSNIGLIKKFANILFQISLTENLAIKPVTRAYSFVNNIQIKNNFIKQTNKKILSEKKVINKNIFYATVFTYLSFNIFFFTGLLYLL